MLKKLLPSVLAILLSLAPTAIAAEVRVSAAASMAEALGEIGTLYAATHPGTTVVPNYAASGTLAKQIVQGAPVDLFISANPKWMDYLVEEKRIPADGLLNMAFNSLVLVGSKELKIKSLDDLHQLRRIAIGSPKSVPAGQYAEEALTKAGLYHELTAERKLVLAQDVRQALLYADRGEVDAAFVYRTDALLARDAVILFAVPAEFHARVAYPMGLTEAGKKNPDAVDFFRFLQSSEAGKILQKHGFVLD
jgi:molybdate transport system substrate-binding protein